LRIYIDLWIKELDSDTANILWKLGFKAVAVEKLNTDKIKPNDIVVVKKKVIEARSRQELRERLRGVSREHSIISIKPYSIEAARMAAHDSRVDTIIIDKDTLKYMDKNQFSLMKQFSKPLEVSFKTLIEPNSRVKAMIYRRINYYLLYTKLPLIVSSEATKWNEVLVPVSTISFLTTLFNIDSRDALLSISNYPREILVRKGVSI